MYCEKMFENICRYYKTRYVNIFKSMYPSLNDTGFTEKNLSGNFAMAYEKYCEEKGQEAITWFEFQFGDNHNEHYDAVIINTTLKEIIVVEAKRYSEFGKKLTSVNKDIGRIKKFPIDVKERIPNISQYSIYGVIVADVWTAETTSMKRKKKMLKQYINNTFILENKEIFSNCSDKDEFIYNVQDFHDSMDIINAPLICSDYYLLSMMWRLTV